MPTLDEFYQRLGATPADSNNTLENKWKTALKNNHPDKTGLSNGDPGWEEANNKAAGISEAYRFLNNEGNQPIIEAYRRGEIPGNVDISELVSFQTRPPDMSGAAEAYEAFLREFLEDLLTRYVSQPAFYTSNTTRTRSGRDGNFAYKTLS